MTDRVWHTLDALAHGTEFLLVDDRDMVITYPGGAWRVEGEDLDELVRRGWVDLSDPDRVEVTPAGRYWLAKWARRARRGAPG